MITINTIDDRKFSLNGIPYLRNYISKIYSTSIEIFNCYERNDILVDKVPCSQIVVNGSSFANPAALQLALLDTIYSRNTLGGEVVDQDNIDIRKYFRYSTSYTSSQILARINALPSYTVTEKQSVWFVGRTFELFPLVGSSGSLGSPTRSQLSLPTSVIKYKMLNKGKGIYGAGGIQLTINDLELIYQNAPAENDVAEDPETDIINFGDIGIQQLHVWLNAQTAPVIIQQQDEGYTLFKGMAGGEAKSYLWIGGAGTYGSGATQATVSDFQLIEDTPPTPYIPSQDEVTAAGDTIVNRKHKFIKAANGIEIQSHSIDDLGEHFKKNGLTISEQYADPVANVKYTKPAKAQNDTYAMLSDFEEREQQGLVKAVDFKYPDGYLYQPFNITEYNGSYSASMSCKDLVRDKISRMTAYYVGYPGAANTNDGLTPTTSLATVAHAYNTKSARLIYIAKGFHAEGLFDTIASTGTSDLFIIGEGVNKTFLSTAEAVAVSWTMVSGAMYSAAVTNCNRAIDTKYVDPKGFVQSLMVVKSMPLCQATPGTYYINGNNIYVHLNDGRIPDANVKVLKGVFNGRYAADAGYLYVEGITFVGGRGTFTVEEYNAGTNNQMHALFKNCNFIHGGGKGAGTAGQGEGLRSSGVNTVWLENCVAYNNDRDGFNYSNSGTLTSSKVIEANCQSFNNGGTDGTNTVNGSSAHQTNWVLRLGGKYYGNYGPNVIDINGAQTLNIGVIAFDSKGAVPPTAGFPGNGDFATGTDNSLSGIHSKMWVYDCKSFNPSYAFATNEAAASGTIYIDSKTRYNGNTQGNIVFQEFLSTLPKLQVVFPPVSTYIASAGNLTEYTGAYSQVPTFVGTTPPSGTTTHNYKATKVGRLVTVAIHLRYSVPGAAITQFTIPFPSGLPVPATIPGFTGTNDYLYPANAFLGSSPGSGGASVATRAYLRKTAGNLEINVQQTSAGYAVGYIVFSYWTD